MKLLICLYSDANSTCKTIANLAAEINSGAKELNLYDLAGVFKSECILFPFNNEGYEIGAVDDNELTIVKSKPDAILAALEIKVINL